MQTLNRVKHSQFNLLLVEDDEVDVMNVKRALRKNDISLPLFHASNGVEALRILRDPNSSLYREHHQVLILLDLNMPKMGGLEFLEVLRNDTELRATPVIILTTSDQAQDLNAAYDFNVAGYMLKPVDFQKFVETIGVISRYWSLCATPESAI